MTYNVQEGTDGSDFQYREVIENSEWVLLQYSQHML